MSETAHDAIKSQFGAAINMLERVIAACPESVWNAPSPAEPFPDAQPPQHRFWYLAFHTLFWLDYYLTDDITGFQPPPPFGLEELDPDGAYPSRAYTRDELLGYLGYCRQKLVHRMTELASGGASRMWKSGNMEFTLAELSLYNMRHVQHHAAQLNLILRQQGHTPPGWVRRAKA